MKVKKNNRIIILVILILLAVIFIVPLPYYLPQQVNCKMGQTNCPHQGWNLNGTPLYIKVLMIFKSPYVPSQPIVTPTNSSEITIAENKCKLSGGEWLNDFKECEGPGDMLTEKECINLGGKYASCESPCRHDPVAELCTTVCIKVCKF